MLKIINIVLIAIIIILSIYIIKINYKIARMHYQTEILIKEYNINKHINKQLMLEIENKKSNIYIKEYTNRELKMFKPKIIRTLD